MLAVAAVTYVVGPVRTATISADAQRDIQRLQNELAVQSSTHARELATQRQLQGLLVETLKLRSESLLKDKELVGLREKLSTDLQLQENSLASAEAGRAQSGQERMVDVALSLLRQEPSASNSAIQAWAAEVLSVNSGVALTSAAKRELTDKNFTLGDMWGPSPQQWYKVFEVNGWTVFQLGDHEPDIEWIKRVTSNVNNSSRRSMAVKLPEEG